MKMELAIRILNFVAPYLPRHIYDEALSIINCKKKQQTMKTLEIIEYSHKEFLENHGITCTKFKDGGWELESYTDGGGDQIVYVNHLTSNELIEYLENYDVNEETNLWFPNGQPGKGVPFDNYKDLWDDIENWRQWMLGIAKYM